jgi:nitrite reductase (cytochrome c-552)
MQISKSSHTRALLWLLAAALMSGALSLAACAPDRPEPTAQEEGLPPGTFEPSEWGELYPQQYRDWQATADPRPPGSRYKKGGERAENGEEGADGEPLHDKLSQYPFLAPMAKGIGFSVEFNEPRGHALAMIDQNAIDPARLGAGGVCLACKSPYWETILEQEGDSAYSMPYDEAVALIPEEHQELGVTCIDCHEPEDNSLRYSDLMADGLSRINAPEALEGKALNDAVCGQCHSTYTIPRGEGNVAEGLFLPWDGGEVDDISVENIIETIEGDPANAEFTQELTGLRLGYIRHPEYELFTRGDVHHRNGVSCVDCHQPFKIRGGEKVSDHNVMSPLNDEMRACRPCHPGQSVDDLRQSVFEVQDRFVGALLNSGFQVVANAQLIRMVNESDIDIEANETAELYGEAIETYKEAFYRVGYLAGENSVGFHNPPEAFRILNDAQAFSMRADGILRTILGEGDVDVPAEVDLQLREYIENRGVRRQGFDPDQEFRDPRGIAERLWNDNLQRLREGGRGEIEDEPQRPPADQAPL